MKDSLYGEFGVIGNIFMRSEEGSRAIWNSTEEEKHLGNHADHSGDI
jgi:hypothetical protein